MKRIESDKAPAAVGPYSQAIESEGFVFCSGQIGIDPKTGTLVEGIKAQTEQVLSNLSAVLAAAGCSMGEVVSATVYLKDMADYAQVNEIYGQAFAQKPQPARVTVAVAALPKDALLEISCIAHK